MHYLTTFFQETSIWGLFFATFFLLLISFEGGFFLGKQHRLSATREQRSPISSLVAATLGLLAFLLAFTFSLAATKHDERRVLVVQEANAVGTTLLRAGYLDEPYQAKIRDLLKKYVATRLEAIRTGKLAEGVRESEKLQDLMWSQAVLVAREHPRDTTVGLFIESLNEVIDFHTKRINLGIYFRLPFIIWGILYFVTVLAIGCIGYQFGLFDTHYLAITLILILSFTAVIILIADLDRPQEGIIKVSQQSLIDLMVKIGD